MTTNFKKKSVGNYPIPSGYAKKGHKSSLCGVGFEHINDILNFKNLCIMLGLNP